MRLYRVSNSIFVHSVFTSPPPRSVTLTTKPFSRLCSSSETRRHTPRRFSGNRAPIPLLLLYDGYGPRSKIESMARKPVCAASAWSLATAPSSFERGDQAAWFRLSRFRNSIRRRDTEELFEVGTARKLFKSRVPDTFLVARRTLRPVVGSGGAAPEIGPVRYTQLAVSFPTIQVRASGPQNSTCQLVCAPTT